MNEPEVPTTPPPDKRKRLLVPLASLAALVVFSFVAFSIFSTENNTPAIQKLIQSPTPTPLPFYEITIPALRERTYESALGELEKTSENASYESYLTSYDSDGLRINGLLTKPTGPQPSGGYPAIIFIHGYIPPLQYQTTANYAAYVDSFARNGFVVFKIDLRGHADSEGEASGGYFSSDYVIDILSARAALGASSFINKDKIGLWGHSMSGNLVMRSLAIQPEIPAAVIWAGAVYTYTDMFTYGISDNSYQPAQTSTKSTKQRQQIRDVHGNPNSESPFWKLMAPTNYLTDLKGAIEIHHATDDPVVSVSYSRDLITLLDKTTVPHTLYEYPTGGHNITGNSFNQAMQRSVEFYKKYLGE